MSRLLTPTAGVFSKENDNDDDILSFGFEEKKLVEIGETAQLKVQGAFSLMPSGTDDGKLTFLRFRFELPTNNS